MATIDSHSEKASGDVVSDQPGTSRRAGASTATGPVATGPNATGGSNAHQAHSGAAADTRVAENHGRVRVVALWAVQAVVALVFVFAAVAKFTGNPDAVKVFSEIGWGDWLRYFTATAELAGAIGLLVPRLIGLAALGLFGVMAGAVVAEVALGHSPVAPLVLAVLTAAIAWLRRDRTVDLIRSLTSR